MKIQILFIFFIGVYYVFGETSFIPKGQRAEIFELTDNEVPVFRITLPDEEFKTFKSRASLIYTSQFVKKNLQIKNIVDVVNQQNFTEIFPGYNFKEILPELPMNENGHPNIDYEKYTRTIYNFNNKEFLDKRDYFIYVFNDDSYLNLIKVFSVLSNLDISSEADEKFIVLINMLGKNIEYDEEGKIILKEENYNYFISENDSFIKDYFGYNFNYDIPTYSYDDTPSRYPYDDTPSYYPSDSPSYYPYNDSPSYYPYDDTPSRYPYDEIPSSSIDDDSDTKRRLLNAFYKYFISIFYNKHRNDEYGSPSQAAIDEDDYNSPSQYINGGFNDLPSNAEFICNEESTDCFFYHQFNHNNDHDDDITPSFDNSNYFYPSFGNSEKFNEEFEKLFIDYDFEKNKANKSGMDDDDDGYSTDFKTKNATMTVEINNQMKSFKKITFSLGGAYSRTFAKPGFNVKIRGGKELFGRRQFKLRGDALDPSLMRTKLVSDIHNRLGMPSLSANYATLYINNEYMGLYVLTDVFKESWVEYVYGEKDTSLLYKCNYSDLTYHRRSGFINENKEATNTKELYKFLMRMTVAESPSDVETIFDLDQFYKELAIYVLTSSWDHSVHNYYIYKHNEKWIYLSQDFDLDMGNGYYGPNMRIESLYDNEIVKKFVSKDKARFKKIMKEIVTEVFNPATLFPRIDELKTFIRPYVELDKTPNEKGRYPGVINYRYNPIVFSLKDWEDGTEYKSSKYGAYALKKFILLKYRVVCKEYDIECDPVYLDKHYGMAHNNTSEAVEESKDKKMIIIENDIEPTQSVEVSPSETIIASSSTETNDNTNFNEENNNKNTNNSIQCLAELIGYPCCSPDITTVYQQDDYGDWSYDFSKQEWCGLTKYEDFSSQGQEQNQEQEQCWSEVLGYPCCHGCKVYEKDSDGEWGYELNHWCGIISSRCNK